MNAPSPPPARFDPSARWAQAFARCGLPEWFGHLAFVLCVLAGLGLAWVVASLALKLIVALMTASAEDYQVQRNIGAALFAVLGFAFAGWRTYVADRQSRAARDQAETALTTKITSRINEAVRMLGEEKTEKVVSDTIRWRMKDGNIERDAEGAPVPELDAEGRPLTEPREVERTVPNLEVRIGALHALERIAQDSERDHIPVMRIICAYLRENSKNHEPTDEARKEIARPRVDVQAAFDILARRTDAQRAMEAQAEYHLDLTDLAIAHLLISGLDLRAADLRWARMEGSDLFEARMERADLRGARMERANLSLARMERADLRGARMERANLRWARMERADLSLAWMERANLFGARMEEADLSGAWMEGVDLSEARMEGADLSGARMIKLSAASADLGGAKLDFGVLRSAEVAKSLNLEGDQILTAFWDGSVTWPEALRDPAWPEWRTRVLDDAEFHARWRGWLEAEAGDEAEFYIHQFNLQDVTPIPPDA